MNLVQKTVRGALWTISTGVGSRILGLVGTLVVTRFVDPSEYGEVMVAAVLVLTANQFSTLGLGQYIVANPNSGRGIAFCATVFHVGLGVVAIAGLLAVGGMLAPAVEAPGMTRFLPGLALGALLDRVSFMPERILIRDLRFGVVSATRTAGDVVMTVVSVLLAALGWGGAAIVAGNAARAAVKLVAFLALAERREWLEPNRITRKELRALLGFGVPLAIGAVFHFASRRWDNLLVSRFFGPGPAGMYNLAYNLADVPAIQVGEQVGDVLLPSFARLDAERRPAALLRSLALLGLIVFPLAVGLGVVAPTLIEALLDPRWHPVAPMLLVLSALSVTRPVGWTVTTYLQARQLTRRILWLEAFKFALLVACMLTLGRHSPLAACLAVGIAFGLHTLASLWVVARLDEVPLRRMLACMAAPLSACLPMALAVVGIRHALAGLALPVLLELVLEVAAGALVYVLFVFAVARAPAKDLLDRLFDAVRRRPAVSQG